MSQWQQDAFKEFVQQDAKVQADQRPFFTECLQCFCRYQKTQKAKPDAIYDGTKDGKFTKLPICENYFNDKFNGITIGASISLIIVVVNTILKETTIRLITWVGEDTQSERITSITLGVFVAQFFNTGIVLLLVNANLQEYSPAFIT